MALALARSLYNQLDYNLDREIEAFMEALEAHKSTVNVPAPFAKSGLVENIVKGHGGVYQIIDDAAGRGPSLKETFLLGD